MTAAESLRSELRIVAGARVLFGHQSVGRNVLDGAAKLAHAHGVPLHIDEAGEAGADLQPGLFHALIGANRDPVSKCRAFADRLLGAERAAVDAALMKFCYVDLDADAPLSPSELLDRYAAMVSQIHECRPELKLIHVTMPVCARPRGRRHRLREVLRRPIREHADNALRNAYNDALRARYRGEPLFDLERAECSGPGTNVVEYRGVRVRTLSTEYTTDGGHLNDAGKRAVATELVRALAHALRPAEPMTSSVS
jgi:hypothetical protein